MLSVTIYIETTIHGPAKREAAGMFIVEFIKEDGTPVTREGTMYASETTEQAMILQLILAAMKLLKKPCSVLINIRCEGILAAFDNEWPKQWHDRDWKKANKQLIRNADLWQMVYEEMEKHDVLVEIGGNPYYPAMEMELKEELRRNGHV